MASKSVQVVGPTTGGARKGPDRHVTTAWPECPAALTSVLRSTPVAPLPEAREPLATGQHRTPQPVAVTWPSEVQPPGTRSQGPVGICAQKPCCHGGLVCGVGRNESGDQPKATATTTVNAVTNARAARREPALCTPERAAVRGGSLRSLRRSMSSVLYRGRSIPLDLLQITGAGRTSRHQVGPGLAVCLTPICKVPCI